MGGILGDMFDFNRDGELDVLERAMEIEFLETLEEEDKQTELELAGVNPEELEFMDDDERRDILEEAGLDPDEYDF